MLRSLRLASGPVLAALLLIGTTGTGSASRNGGSPSSDAASATTAFHTIDAGYLTVGEGAGAYPPMDFPDPKNPHAIIGFNADLLAALIRQMGLKGGTIVPSDFTKLLPSLNAGKFDVVMSTLNHTPERAKLVDFVDYMSASEGILVRKGSTIHANGYAGLCGTSLNVVGTTSLEASARAANKRCARKIKIITQSNTPTAVNAFLGGSGDAYLGDLPVVAHYVKMYPGRLREAGKPIPTGQNYGIAYPRTNQRWALRSRERFPR